MVSHDVRVVEEKNSHNNSLQDTTNQVVSQDVTATDAKISHEKPESDHVALQDVPTSIKTTTFPSQLNLSNSAKNMLEMRHTKPHSGTSSLAQSSKEINVASQEATVPTHSGSQDITVSNLILDPLTEKRKEHLQSLGLSDSVYSSNSEVFYPVLTPEQDEVDYISFKDIIDTTWSIPLDNLNSNDIELEQAYLKSHRTSSPRQLVKNTSSSSSSTEILQSPTDSEGDDPTYGRPKKPKPSMRLGRKPSSACIAAQKVILKTKGLKPKLAHTSQALSDSPCADPTTDVPTTQSKTKMDNKQTPACAKDKPVSSTTLGRPSSKHFGLKITQHGIVRQPTVKKGKSCSCEMCGKKFRNSTLFIEHYSTTHPSLSCKHCSKVYTTPLSLQKHVYMHTAEKKTCESCGKSFPLDSQLADHWKTHMKNKPHICTHPNCSKDFTHQYDLLKHE